MPSAGRGRVDEHVIEAHRSHFYDEYSTQLARNDCNSDWRDASDIEGDEIPQRLCDDINNESVGLLGIKALFAAVTADSNVSTVRAPLISHASA